MEKMASEENVHVLIAQDAMSASLRIEADVDPESLHSALCLAVLRERGVVVDQEVERRATELVERHRADPSKEIVEIVAQGQAPEHGVDERLEFRKEFDPALKDVSLTNGGGAVSHYERSSVTSVSSGTQIATLHPATEGADGWTVQGKALPAKRGKSLGLKLDDSVDVKPDGAVLAHHDGLLEFKGGWLRVKEVLEIKENVDFSTGNVQFGGDVLISGSVKDCFTVSATGSIVVRQLVEAATLTAGVDIALEGGMAAREKGEVQAWRDVTARYLDSVSVSVGRDLEVAKEIVNCTLWVAGAIRAPRCAVIGGEIRASGAVDLGVIGAEGGAGPEITLGRIPEVDALREKCRGLAPIVGDRLAKVREERATLERNSSKLTSTQAEQVMELQFEEQRLTALEAALIKGQGALDAMDERHATVDLTAQTRLHRGVALDLPDHTVQITESLKGPLRITLGADGRPVVTDLLRDTTVDLREMARVRPKADMDENRPKGKKRAA